MMLRPEPCTREQFRSFLSTKLVDSRDWMESVVVRAEADPVYLDFRSRAMSLNPRGNGKLVYKSGWKNRKGRWALPVWQMACVDAAMRNTPDAFVALGLLKRASLYMMREDIWRLVCTTPDPKPFVVCPNELLAPCMFFCMENPFAGPLTWIMLTDLLDGVAVTTFDSTDSDAISHGFVLPYGKRYPDHDTDSPFMAKLVLNLMAFLRSKLVGVVKKSAGSTTKNGRMAAAKDGDDTDVSVIVLRQRDHPLNADPGDLAAVNWNHHWWVDPHSRNQYFPSTQEHHPVMIQSYIKGPLDKPLLTKVHDVRR